MFLDVIYSVIILQLPIFLLSTPHFIFPWVQVIYSLRSSSYFHYWYLNLYSRKNKKADVLCSSRSRQLNKL